MRKGAELTLACSILAQQVNEPTADCISSLLIDLSEHVNAHVDRISPAVTQAHTNTQISALSLQEN